MGWVRNNPLFSPDFQYIKTPQCLKVYEFLKSMFPGHVPKLINFFTLAHFYITWPYADIHVVVNGLDQGSPTLFLESYRPVGFRSNRDAVHLILIIS